MEPILLVIVMSARLAVSLRLSSGIALEKSYNNHCLIDGVIDNRDHLVVVCIVELTGCGKSFTPSFC